jgi:hypothetical protein
VFGLFLDDGLLLKVGQQESGEAELDVFVDLSDGPFVDYVLEVGKAIGEFLPEIELLLDLTRQNVLLNLVKVVPEQQVFFEGALWP